MHGLIFANATGKTTGRVITNGKGAIAISGESPEAPMKKLRELWKILRKGTEISLRQFAACSVRDVPAEAV